MIICLGATPTVQRTMTFARLQINAVNRAIEVTETASGKSLNVARVLATLGEQVTATGVLGGRTGDFLRRDLDAAGIAHDFVSVAPATRVCVTVIDQDASTATELIEESKAVEPQAWDTLRQTLKRLLRSAKVLVMSGTLTPGAPQDFYAQCVRMAADANVRAVVDATGEPLKHSLTARPFLVKPNRVELSWTLQVPAESDDQLKRAIEKLLEQGPQWAVVTMGADGAIISNGKEFWCIRQPPVRAISPIGSGDAFAAGLAAGIARGEPLPHAARLGAACAAANAIKPVAGHIDRADVERLLEQMVLESW